MVDAVDVGDGGKCMMIGVLGVFGIWYGFPDNQRCEEYAM
jgi:hypothetical protein